MTAVRTDVVAHIYIKWTSPVTMSNRAADKKIVIQESVTTPEVKWGTAQEDLVIAVELCLYAKLVLAKFTPLNF